MTNESVATANALEDRVRKIVDLFNDKVGVGYEVFSDYDHMLCIQHLPEFFYPCASKADQKHAHRIGHNVYIDLGQRFSKFDNSNYCVADMECGEDDEGETMWAGCFTEYLTLDEDEELDDLLEQVEEEVKASLVAFVNEYTMDEDAVKWID